MAYKAFKENEDFKVLKVLQGLKGQKALRESPVFKDLRVKEDLRVSLVLKGLSDLRGLLVRKGLQESLNYGGIQSSLTMMDMSLMASPTFQGMTRQI